MRTFKHVLFWVLFILFMMAAFRHQPFNDVGSPTLIPVGLLIALAYGIYSWFRGRQKFKLPPDLRFRNFKQSQQSADSDLQAHADLVSMCMGDVAKVERLIRYEQSKRPGLGRAQATRAARDRLRYDRWRS